MVSKGRTRVPSASAAQSAAHVP